MIAMIDGPSVGRADVTADAGSHRTISEASPNCRNQADGGHHDGAGDRGAGELTFFGAGGGRTMASTFATSNAPPTANVNQARRLPPRKLEPLST
jgi:hypothetical protein